MKKVQFTQEMSYFYTYSYTQGAYNYKV